MLQGDKAQGSSHPFFGRSRAHFACFFQTPTLTNRTCSPNRQHHAMSCPIYCYNKNTGIHMLQFQTTWPSTRSEDFFLYEKILGDFTFHVKRIQGIYLFSIETEWADSTRLSGFKNCSVNDTNGAYITFEKISFRPAEADHQDSTCNTIHLARLMTTISFTADLTLLGYSELHFSCNYSSESTLRQ